VVVYVVTSYEQPEQLHRLLARLRRSSPGSRLVVSHDRKSPPLDPGRLAEVEAVGRVTPTPVTWGDASYLHSILAVVRDEPLAPTDWLVLLTASDYPLRPLADFERHLAACGADALLEAPEPGPALDAVTARYRRRSVRPPAWLVDGRRRARLVAAAARRLPGVLWCPQPHGIPPTLEVRRLRTPFGPDLALHKGCDLFALDGRARERLLAAPPRLLRYFDRTAVPSEAYPHTVLRNDPAVVVRPEMLHFGEWVGSPHPRHLGVEDLPAMLGSGRWFARKFRPEDPVLDRLDALLDGAG